MGSPTGPAPAYGMAAPSMPADPPEFHQVQQYLRFTDRLTPLFGAAWLASGVLLVFYYLLLALIFMVFAGFAFLVFLLGIPGLIGKIDGGHFEEARKDTLIWAILGLVGGIVSGVLLLLVWTRTKPLIEWQQQVLALQGGGAAAAPPPMMAGAPPAGAAPPAYGGMAPPAPAPYTPPSGFSAAAASGSSSPPPTPSGPSNAGYLSTPAFSTYPAGSAPSPASPSAPPPPPPPGTSGASAPFPTPGGAGAPAGRGGFARVSATGPPNCSKCGKPTTFVPQYSKYYCYGCAVYAT